MTSHNCSMPQGIACFSCSGSELVSYLKSGYFQQFLNSELTVTSGCTIKLFGKLLTNYSVFTNLQHLFMEIKRAFSIVKGVAIENTDYFRKESSVADIEILRMDIVKSFHILSANLQRMNLRHCNSTLLFNDSENGSSHLKFTIMQLIKEIKNLLVYVGRLSSIESINYTRDFNDISRSAQYFYHYYHLCLDIWYNCIALLYVAHALMPISLDEVFCDFVDQSSPFLQLTSFLIYELSFLAINRYKNAHMCQNSPFLCTCMKEFWIMLIHLIDRFSSHIERSSFWNIYLSVIQIIINSVSSPSSNEDLYIDMFSKINSQIHIENPIEVCLWLTSYIAPLYKFNALGYFCEYETAKSGYVVTKYLVHSLLSILETREKVLRNALSYCIQLTKLWEPSGDILLPLTDFYIKKINETFNIREIDLSYLFKDALSWFTYVNNLSNLVSLGKETSFDHFLCILNLQLSRDADNSLWRSLKGRIYSKFTPKKIKEMSEVGLQNSFSLFHVIVTSGQLEIINKICDITSLIDTTANPRKQIISWKALFVLLYIYQEKNYNAEKITSCISKFFNSACADYSKISYDSMYKTNLMNLLLEYVDNVNELFKRNISHNSSVYQLLSIGFSDLLQVCGVTERNYILSVILSILQRIQKVTESGNAEYVTNETEYIKLMQLILNNIYPFIESMSFTDDAPLIVSDIAATLTKLAFDFSSLINTPSFDFYKIFMHFASKETVSSHVTSRYLCFILDYPGLVKDIRIKLTDLDVLIFQSWLKCIVCTRTKNDGLQEFSQKVLQQSVITKIFPDVSFLDVDDHVNLSIKFFHLIGDAYAKCSPQEKTNMAHKVQQFFKNYVSFVLNKIKKEKDGPTFSHVYKLTSHLVEHCSLILHIHVTSEDILLQILDQTVYPQLIFPRDKALQYLAACSIKEHLPQFMRGLFKLDYRKDKSAEREIRDIFTYYIGVLPVSGNPLIKLVVDSVSKKPDGLSVEAYIFILETLKCNLLSNNIENPKSVFQFYQEIFRQVPPACKKEISTILLTCAMEIYMKQTDSLAEFLKVLINKIVIYFKDKMMLNHSKIILIPVIQWFIQEKLQWSVARGFSILDIYVDYVPQIMSDILPFLTKSVQTLEKNRGLGEDMLLRNGLRNIVSKLQRKLNES